MLVNTEPLTEFFLNKEFKKGKIETYWYELLKAYKAKSNVRTKLKELKGALGREVDAYFNGKQQEDSFTAIKDVLQAMSENNETQIHDMF